MIRLLVLILVALNLLLVAWVYWGNTDRIVLTAATSAPAQVRPTAAPPACATIGPFTDPQLIAQLQEKLRLDALVSHPREASESRQDGWWVYVDSTDQEHQAQALSALRKADLHDAVAMPDDPQFRISVGLFSTEERAEDRATQVRRLKLDAMVAGHFKEQKVTWLDLPGVAQEALRDGRLAAAGVAMENLRLEACPTATPATTAPAAADIIPPP